MKFCFHKWGKWSSVIEEPNGDLHQVAQCEKCNAVTRRLAVDSLSARLSSRQVREALVEAEAKAQDKNV